MRIGLLLFVYGFVEVGGALTDAKQASMDGLTAAHRLSIKQVLEDISMALFGLSKCASF